MVKVSFDFADRKLEDSTDEHLYRIEGTLQPVEIEDPIEFPALHIFEGIDAQIVHGLWFVLTVLFVTILPHWYYLMLEC